MQETTSMIDSSLLEDVKRLLEVDKFIETYRDEVGKELEEEEILTLHGKLLVIFGKATEAYKQAVLHDLKSDKADLDEKHSIILSEAVQNMHDLLKDQKAEMEFTPKIVRSFNCIMFELKNIFEDLINRWLKFYTKEFWIMTELGITEFSTMDKYVHWKLMNSLDKVNPEVKYLREMFAEFIDGVSAKTGMAILQAGFDFKKKVRNSLELLNQGVQQCAAMTPFVAKYEFTRLRLRIGGYAQNLKNKWFLQLYANKDILDEYEKGLFENIENSPRLVFDTNDGYSPIDYGNQEPAQPEKTEETVGDSTKDEDVSTEIMDQQKGEFLSQEEKDIMEFLSLNPSIDQARKARMEKMYKELSDKEVKDVKYFVNEKGRLAKLVKFQGESDYLMIRNDEQGNKVISRKINNQWFQVDKSYVMSGRDASQFFVSKPFNFQLADATVGGTLAMSGTGALGNFLYKLVEGKEKINNLSRGLVRDAGSSVALTVLMTTMPFVAVSIASVVGVKALNDLRSNKFIKGSKKVSIVSDIVARTGTKAAMTIGGAAVGQTMIPVPFLGAFIGGVVGGFTASALESSYDSLIAKRVSMELLCFFSIVKMKKRGKWAKERLSPQDAAANEETMKQFIEILSLVVAKPIELQSFERELTMTKQEDLFDLVDEIYASIADKDKGEQVDEIFAQRWKTLVIYCFYSYYYYLLYSQLDSLQFEEKITEDQKIEALDRYESLLDVTEVLEWISPQLSIFGQYKPYEKFVACINQMLKDCKIVTRFKIPDPKKVQEEKEKQEKKKEEEEKAKTEGKPVTK